MKGQHRTFDECLASARQYATATEWKHGDYTRFQYAYCHKWHVAIKREMKWPISYSREYEDSLEEARPFTSLHAWASGSRSTYAYAYRRGWQRRIAQDLGWPFYRKRSVAP